MFPVLKPIHFRPPRIDILVGRVLADGFRDPNHSDRLPTLLRTRGSLRLAAALFAAGLRVDDLVGVADAFEAANAAALNEVASRSAVVGGLVAALERVAAGDREARVPLAELLRTIEAKLILIDVRRKARARRRSSRTRISAA